MILARVAAGIDEKKEVLAKRAGYTRAAFYKHTGKANLSDAILMKYGKAWQYDFTEEIPGLPRYMEDNESFTGRPSTIDEAVKQREFFREKYYRQLDLNSELRSTLEKERSRRK